MDYSRILTHYVWLIVLYIGVIIILTADCECVRQQPAVHHHYPNELSAVQTSPPLLPDPDLHCSFR